MGAFDNLDLQPVSADDKSGRSLQKEVYSVTSLRELRNTWKNTAAGAKATAIDLVTLPDEKAQKEQHEKDLKQYDLSGNGKLDDVELRHAIENAKTVYEILRLDDLHLYDKNRDGSINGKEAERRQADIKKSQDQQLKKYDTTNDGMLDKDERKRQVEDLLDAQKVPLSEKELKERIAVTAFDLKANFEKGDMSDLMIDIYRAHEKMPRVQFEQYLKAVNDEFHKINPNADILEVEYFNQLLMRVKVRDGQMIGFLRSDQAEMAKTLGR